MTRLARDRRGSTLAIMAAAMIPVAAFAGIAVDVARLYLVKVRLQQACDAGALAGRKFLVDSAAANIDANAQTQANTFFDNNFRTGMLGTSGTARSFSKTADMQVAGIASTVVPMTVTRFLGAGDTTLSTACAARYDVPDVDLMMVLDTTGSMACAPGEPDSCGQGTFAYSRSDGTTGYALAEKSTSRIVALRSAVLAFYDAVDASTDPLTHVRYGFVPYTSTVNVGYQLPAGSMVSDRWKYQSRRAIADQNYGSAYDTSFGNINQVNCNAKAARSPALTTNTIGQTVYNYDTNGNAQRILVKSWTANATGSTNGSCVITTQPVVPVWRYAQWEADVSQYVAGNSVQDPSKYTSSQNKWQGCIEERDTSADLTFDADSLPPDLDPDLAPTTNATRWRPMWPEQIYDRSGTASYDIHDGYLPPKAPGNGLQNYYGYFVNTGGDASRVAAGFVSCGKSVQRLAELSRNQVSSYLNAPEFRPLGGTYHDVGMIWGTRLISSTGMFANDTSSWPGRMAPNRHIIFMTDGNLSPNEAIYGMYGVERYDQRVTGGDFATIANRHNARFRAVCEAAQQRNVTVWVISFSNALNDDLKACATPPWNQHAFQANDAAALNSAFQSIAKQVASLRIYQ